MTQGIVFERARYPCDACGDSEPQGLRWTLKLGNTVSHVCAKCRDTLHEQTAAERSLGPMTVVGDPSWVGGKRSSPAGEPSCVDWHDEETT